jgi:hypothetical protein
MYIASVPSGFLRVGHGHFVISSATKKMALFAAKFSEATGNMESVHRAMIAGLEEQPTLVEQVGQLLRPGLAYTVDGPPATTRHGEWRVPFTAYVFERPGQREAS